MKQEICVRHNQFGGISGTGTQHYLIRMWNEIHEALQSKEATVSIMAIDFTKAFNSVQHGSIVRRGSPQTWSMEEFIVQMTAAFLRGQTMRVRIKDILSRPLPINGGSPQGTLLGNFLFTIVKDEIEDDVNDNVENRPPALPAASGDRTEELHPPYDRGDEFDEEVEDGVKDNEEHPAACVTGRRSNGRNDTPL